MSQHPHLHEIAKNRMSPFTKMLGLEFKSLEKGLCTLLLSIREEHFNGTARVHGGVIFSLLDSAMGAAAFSVLEPHESTATVECKINYTRAVIGGELECFGKVVHAGTRTVVVDGEIWQDGALVAKALGTFARI
ncbi:PaaI family thioesterase [Halopseudomonas pelagia]|mgnify:CR=1 FL=1|uniref:PaaI family thioesterase n=1 Tax=Halopseudomonas pelagia TaxID=553151 RepID=UPI0003A6D803|nr:PaaI family thioesterase [Halopseudomonas pelagia]|tara:strand:- start:2461 stop:2862 length:402 start_codon:yes stop_codon:yes gene_type:complete